MVSEATGAGTMMHIRKASIRVRVNLRSVEGRFLRGKDVEYMQWRIAGHPDKSKFVPVCAMVEVEISPAISNNCGGFGWFESEAVQKFDIFFAAGDSTDKSYKEGGVNDITFQDHASLLGLTVRFRSLSTMPCAGSFRGCTVRP